MARLGTLQNNTGIFAPLCDRAQQQIDHILHSHEQLFLGEHDEDNTTSSGTAVALETLLGGKGDALAPEDCYVRIMERRPKARPLLNSNQQQNAHIADLTKSVQTQVAELTGVLFSAAIQTSAYVCDLYVRLAAWIESAESRVEARVAAARTRNTPALSYIATHTEQHIHTEHVSGRTAPAETMERPTYAPIYTQMQHTYRNALPQQATSTRPSSEHVSETTPAVARVEQAPSAWSYAMQSLKRELLGKM